MKKYNTTHIISSKVNVYLNVRCGLAHAYIIEGNATIVIEGGTCWILYDETSNSYTFCVRCCHEDFKSTVNQWLSRNNRLL